MIVRDAKFTQPFVNIETLPYGSYILYNGLIGIISPYRRNVAGEQLSNTIYILNETKLSDFEHRDNLNLPKGTKVLPVKIKTIEYEAIERNPYDYS